MAKCYEISTYSQPLSIILLGGGEKSVQRVVGRDNIASKIGQELATEVEDDEEEVKSNDANGSISLGDTRSLLEVVQSGVLRQLFRGYRSQRHWAS